MGDTDGAKKLTNLTQTLFDCEVEVNTSCHTDNFPAANATKISECELAVATFKTETKKCVDLSKAATASDACECWTSSNYSSISDAVKTCKISEVSTVAKGLKACTAAFSKCRKFEDDVVHAFSTCYQSVSDHTVKAAALNKNKAALIDVKAKVAKATGTSRGRVARAAATDCASFIVLVANLVMAVQDDLTTATGTTASAAALSEAAEATTAAATTAAPAVTAAPASPAAAAATAAASASASGSTASGRFR